MNDTLDEMLRDVTESTLEGLAFMFTVPEEGADGASAAVAETARVHFSGPFTGAVTIGASSDMLPALASNMLGLEDDVVPTADHQTDSLKEFANVLCGNLLPKLAGTEAVFDVSAPELVASAGNGDRPPAATVALALDEGHARVALYLDEPGAVS